MSIENKCTGCGGELLFDIDSQNLKCKQCGNIVEIKDKKALETKNDYLNNQKNQKIANVSTYKCENCGKTTVIKKEDQIIRCSHCNSPHLQLTNKIEFEPDGIIPFTINKETVTQNFRRWVKGKLFTPSVFKRYEFTNTFSAFYLPAYNYDVETFSSYSGIGVNRDSNDHSETTTHFSGTKANTYNNFLTSVTDRVSSKTLRKCGRFNYNNLKVYSLDYLYGFTTFDVNTNLETSTKSALKDIDDDIKFNIKRSYMYDEIRNFVCNTTHNKILYNHVYVPVWTTNIEYKKKNYSFLINGSDGKITGRVPRSMLKISSLLLAIAVGAGLLFLLL